MELIPIKTYEQDKEYILALTGEKEENDEERNIFNLGDFDCTAFEHDKRAIRDSDTFESSKRG